MNTIAVVDCGMGNLHSVIAGVRRAAPHAQVHSSADAAVIARADKVIFPGDGNFGACMEAIERRNLRHALCDAARQKPFLGICVGMQVLFRASEEATAPGLGLLDGTVGRLPQGEDIKIPHIGWNTVRHERPSPFTAGVHEHDYFYFVHSYCAPVGEWTLMTCTYGTHFSAIVGRGNILATQFHPEKSGASGERLLHNFLTGAGEAAA